MVHKGSVGHVSMGCRWIGPYRLSFCQCLSWVDLGRSIVFADEALSLPWSWAVWLFDLWQGWLWDPRGGFLLSPLSLMWRDSAFPSVLDLLRWIGRMLYWVSNPSITSLRNRHKTLKHRHKTSFYWTKRWSYASRLEVLGHGKRNPSFFPVWFRNLFGHLYYISTGWRHGPSPNKGGWPCNIHPSDIFHLN